jgi:bla regulator protein blaR1
VPVVIGHLRPVILLPVQLVTSLPLAQLEPILLHELAHIFRKDYFVNLLMTAIETLFFFNPAVLWVATLIRRERENCCDDLTIEHTGGTTDYIEALLCCQQLQQESPMLVPALMGQSGDLLMRVKRMLYNHNRTLNKMEKSIISISLVTTALLALAFTGRPLPEKETAITPMPAWVMTSSTETTCTTVETLSANHYFLFTDATDTVPASPKVPVAPATPGAPAMQVPAVPSAPAIPDTDSMNPPAAPAAPLPASKQRLNNLTAPASPLKEKLSPLETAAPAAPSLPRKKTLSATAPLPPSPITEPGITAPPPPPAPASEVNDKVDKIVSEMLADGIIQGDIKHLSFKLSTTELIVNGKKQPKEMFEKYRQKYVDVKGRGDWSWYYNYDTETVVK